MLLLILFSCLSPNQQAVRSPRARPDLGGEDTGFRPADSGDVADSADTAGEPTEADSARIVSATFPDTLACDASGTATVTVENTGSATWTRTLGYKLGAVDDEDALIDGDVRVWLAEGDVVSPGDRHVFEIELAAPSQSTTALSDWQMVHEGVRWFGEHTAQQVEVSCEGDTGSDETYPLPLPDMSDVVDAFAAENPDLLARSCQSGDGTWEFMDGLVDLLRETDDRWGYNWKRGNEGDPSGDVVDYHYGPGTREGSTDVYILDVIVGHCGDNPQAGWLDQTAATAAAGTIGRWTGRGRF